MIIILADADPDYLENLRKRLNSAMIGISIFACQSIMEMQNKLDTSDWCAGLIIFNPVDFPNLPDLLGTYPERQIQYWPIIIGNPAAHPPIDESNDRPVHRYGKTADLAEKIRFWQKNHLVRNLMRPQAAEPVVPIVSAEINLLFCMRSVGYQPAISRQRLKEMLISGQRVVYLPLMPTYQMSCLSPPGYGPSLSDLLLQLLGKNITTEQLAQYWQPHPDGFLQFRPPDRSDDLVLCSPDLLRSLVNLLRERLNQDNEPGKALVDCAGLPLATVSSIAVLCNCCEILFPERACFATDAARREISQILAHLPATCKILENHQE